NIHGDVLPRTLLSQGFIFNDQRISLVSPAGIFQPRMLKYPLTITTTPGSPYDDKPGDEGFFLYKYRGSNHFHRDNIGLREAMRNNVPLIYFFGIVPGKYLSV